MSIAAVLIVSFLTLIVYAQKVSNKNINTFRANLYLTEMVEALKDLENTSWASLDINTCEAPSMCHTAVSGGVWSIETGEEALDDGRYIRSINIEEVHRDQLAFPNEIVVSGGVPDVGTKKIIATIAWNSSIGAESESLETYVHEF